MHTPDVLVIQTSDPVRYKPMLDITSRACVYWAKLHGLHYAPFVGLKRGTRPGHAIFNRIILLAELAEIDFSGWAIYLDADAYPFDLTYELRSYLGRHAGYALIDNQCQTDQLLLNSGILLFNFADLRTREIITAWSRSLVQRFDTGRISDALEWPDGADNDQSMLHEVLIERGDIDKAVMFESGRLIGDLEAVLLRQVLRRYGDFTWRMNEAEASVRVALTMAEVWGR